MSSRLLTLVLALLTTLAACQPGSAPAEGATEPGDEPSDEPSTETASDDEAAADNEGGEEAAGDDDGAVAQADDAPAADRYPQLLFGLLTPEERTRFVGLAEGELCPCEEGSVVSLDACLQDPEQTCEIALQSAAIMMQGIKEGADDVELLNAIQLYQENMRRVHEFDLEGVPYKGAEDPDIVIVEYADFECPACRMVSGVLDGLMGEYGDRVRVYYRHFPLPTHHNAAVAARAATAAHNQDRFWDMHDRIFAGQAELQQAQDANALLATWAQELGLNMTRWAADLESDAVAARVEADRTSGIEASISATPTLYMDGRMLMGGYDAVTLAATIQARLDEIDAAE